jgi:alanine racemase
MEAVARTLDEVDAFAVARLPEAVALHKAGIDSPIVLLAGVLTIDERDEALERGFQIVVHCVQQIELLEATAAGSTIVWLKFDTGMNRLGFAPEDSASLIARLRACPAVAELRLMSHLASADELDNPVTEEQFEKFRAVVEEFDGAVSVANTPATLGWPQMVDANKSLGFKGDHWVRPGLALYGISPFAGRNGADLGLAPVMQFEARLIATKQLSAGGRVGYRGRYRAQADTILGIISAGYGDGYTRHFRSGTPVLINDRRVPLIGDVSMDMVAVDLGDEATDEVGAIATLWGEGLPVEEVAPWADAIPYELVCGIMHREVSEIID